MRAAALLAALLLVAAVGRAAAAPAAVGDPLGPVADAPTNRGLKPTRWVMDGRSHYFQLPKSPKGTLVTFHGCGRASKAFFPWHPTGCPECLGFPDHVAHTKQALAAGYALLALDPADARQLCWSSANRAPYENDQPAAVRLITQFLGQQGLEGLPLYLLGVSSGGTLALKLAAQMERARTDGGEPPGGRLLRIAGIISEESVPEDFQAADERGRLLYPGFPPTFFVLMDNGDSRRRAQAAVDFLRDGGVPAAFVTSPPRRVVPTFLSDRIPAISQLQSRIIVDALRQIGVLDGEGRMLGDPERNRLVRRNTTSPALNWDAKLRFLLPWLRDDSPTLSLVYRNCSIQQALNVAYARHDAVSDYTTVGLKWLEAGGRGDLPALLEEYTVKDFNLTALTVESVVEVGGDDQAAGEGGLATQEGAPPREAQPSVAPAPGPSAPRANRRLL